MLEWMGLNFYYHDGLQPKIRAGIINEHECNKIFHISTCAANSKVNEDCNNSDNIPLYIFTNSLSLSGQR